MSKALNADRFAIAATLRQIATLLELKKENPYRARAYVNGASALEGLDEDFATVLNEGRLTEVSGIGAALAKQIEEIARSGASPLRTRLEADLPKGVVELASVPGLGLKAIRTLASVLGITSVAELRAACEAGRVRELPGFGPKTEQKLLAGIATRAEKVHDRRVLLTTAIDLAEPLLAYLRDSALVARAELAGPVRRAHETVSAIDIVVASRDAAAALDHAASYPPFAKVTGRGASRCTGHLASGLPVHVRAVAPRAFAVALHAATGSPSHVKEVRARAAARGKELTSRALYRVDGSARVRIAVPTEEALYQSLGLGYSPPERRERGTALLTPRRVPRLVRLGDIRGFVHCHTTFSDGRDTLETMARAADALGMQYMTITDHSPTASYARGLTVDRLKEQWDEIDRVQELVSVKLLRGTESDILRDGALDYPDRILEKFDVVIASIHNRYRLDPKETTDRVVRAMRHRLYKVWGHALGRLLLKRPPIECDTEAILDAIAESRACIEINGDPHRLDMEPALAERARQRGIRFVVSVDAHSTSDLDNLHFGVSMARRAGLRKRDVLNTLDADGFMAAVRPAVRSA